MKTSKGRPTIGSVLLSHYGTKKEMFRNLHKIANQAVKANKDRISFSVIHSAVLSSTGLKFGPITFRNMLREENKKNIPPTSILGKSCRLNRGAPKGSCNNPKGRPLGSKNKPKEAVASATV